MKKISKFLQGSRSLWPFPGRQDHMLMFAVTLPEVTLGHLGPIPYHKLILHELPYMSFSLLHPWGMLRVIQVPF